LSTLGYSELSFVHNGDTVFVSTYFRTAQCQKYKRLLCATASFYADFLL